MSKPLTSEEEWVRQIVALELGVPVHQHDCGTSDSRYDLRVGDPDRPERAIDVIGARDRAWTEAWNVAPKYEASVEGLVGNWAISVDSHRKLKDLRKELPRLLLGLEQHGIAQPFTHKRPLSPDAESLVNRLEKLGVLGAGDYSIKAPGNQNVGKYRFHFLGKKSFGSVGQGHLQMADWISRWLDDLSDVPRKFAGIKAPHREVFVVVAQEGAPFPVLDYLSSLNAETLTLPIAPPRLPEPLTGVWLTAEQAFGGDLGVRWDATTRLWSTFRRILR